MPSLQVSPRMVPNYWSRPQLPMCLTGPFGRYRFPQAPRPLGDISGHDAVWAINKKLYFGKGTDIYVAEHDGSNARRLVTAPDNPQYIALSPDTTRLRFTASNIDNNTSALWEVGVDGGNLHPLFPGWNNPPGECCGNWSPDGRFYYFESMHDGFHNIWVVPDRSSWWRKTSVVPIQLTTGPMQFGNPVPSSDGKTLFVMGVQPRAELVRFDAKSGDFVPYLGGISAGDVEFSQWQIGDIRKLSRQYTVAQ